MYDPIARQELEAAQAEAKAMFLNEEADQLLATGHEHSARIMRSLANAERRMAGFLAASAARMRSKSNAG